MVWQQWTLAGYLVIGTAVYVGRTGRPRKTITALDAACVVVEGALLIWLVLSI